MNLRQAYLEMIKRFPGGWDALCGALGMTRDALSNRIYERRGQGLLVDTAMQMQEFTSSTCFAEAVAALSGGTFVRIAQSDHPDNDELLAKFNELYAHLGHLSSVFAEATRDGLIDRRERADLIAAGDDMHRSLEELLSLSFQIFCRPDYHPNTVAFGRRAQ